MRKSVLLPCPPERAFALFTGEVSAWWPESRRHTDDPGSVITLLPGGRFWERAADGREVELGRVTLWEPPQRLALDFYPGTSPERPTAVVVTFSPEPAGTLVVVEHRPTAASAELWEQRVAAFERSWDEVLAALAAHAAT